MVCKHDRYNADLFFALMTIGASLRKYLTERIVFWIKQKTLVIEANLKNERLKLSQYNNKQKLWTMSANMT